MNRKTNPARLIITMVTVLVTAGGFSQTPYTTFDAFAAFAGNASSADYLESGIGGQPEAIGISQSTGYKNEAGLLYLLYGMPAASHFTTVWTGNGVDQMNFYALTATIDGVEMQPGDEIAVFDGEYCVGVGILTEVLDVTHYLTFIASRNDAEPPDVNGYVPGNTIIFKLWDASAQQEVTSVEVEYTAGSGIFEVNGTASFYINGFTSGEQSIPLTAGWNIFSLAVAPEDIGMENIVQPLVDSGTLVKVQDELGNAIEYVFPIGWVNSIGDWSMTEGYKIKVSENTSLVVTGAPIPLPAEIPVKNGWNIIGYPVMELQPALEVLSDLMDDGHLIKVQDEAGSAIEYVFPIGWVDNIEVFEPGEGYKVKVNTDDTIVVEEQGSLKSTHTVEHNVSLPVHFKPVYEGHGLDHMNVYLTSVRLNDRPPEPGDEVGLFDGDRCVGVGVVAADGLPYLSLAASKDDPGTAEADGFVAGSPIRIKIWSSRYADEISVDKPAFLPGYDNRFDPMATTVASLNVTSTGLPGGEMLTTGLGDNYPNPFSTETMLEFTLGETSTVDISIYNLLGVKVRTLVHQAMESGAHATLWDATDHRGARVPAGIYICRMVAGSYVSVKSLDVIR